MAVGVPRIARMSESIDFDGAWKALLERYLKPFLELCFPDVVLNIDWSVEPRFLDTELEEIVRDADIGRRHADKLIQVRRRDGTAEWVLVHVEVQSQPDRDLPRRLYRYHHRIVDRYGRSAVTLAVLGDTLRDWRPNAYTEELWGCRVQFDYPVCKLLDFSAETLDAANNPAAVVISAHLAVQATRRKMTERKNLKWALTRRLFERGYEREDVLEIFRLIDRLLALPKALEIEFRQELIRYEGERTMPHMTSIERLAREEGLEEGLAKGREEGLEQGRAAGAADLILRQARKRFPGLDSSAEDAIRCLPVNRIEDLGEALLDFSSLDDLRIWLSR